MSLSWLSGKHSSNFVSVTHKMSIAVSRAILKPVYRFGIPNSDPWTLKSVKINSSKNRKMTVAEPPEPCFELFRMQNSQNFLGFCSWTPIPSCTTVFLLATLVEKPAPKKHCWIWHWCESELYSKLYERHQFCFSVSLYLDSQVLD